MIHFSRERIDQLDRFYRMNLINCCSGYKSANLIGTRNEDGSLNLAVFSSVTHMGSNPPLLAFVLRPTDVPRHTYANIMRTGKYTINHVAEGFARQAHHTSAKYDYGVSEFEVTGLEPKSRDDFEAPFVKEAPVQIAMKFVEEHKILANGTILVVGEIQALYVADQMLESDGFLDLSKQKTSVIGGLDGYLVPGNLRRFGYQRPHDENFMNPNLKAIRSDLM